jgi:hypothetical protein
VTSRRLGLPSRGRRGFGGVRLGPGDGPAIAGGGLADFSEEGLAPIDDCLCWEEQQDPYRDHRPFRTAAFRVPAPCAGRLVRTNAS